MVFNNFASLGRRTDKGALWENFLVSERYKKRLYEGGYAQHSFWRTTQQQEIDYIEEQDGILSAFKFKWNPKKLTSIPKTFARAYPNSKFAFVTSENHEQFLLP